MSDDRSESADLLAPLHQFREHTERLLALAEAEQWEQFEAAAKAREALTAGLNDSEFLVAVARAGEEDAFRDEVARIQSLNDRITELAEATKADIADQLREQNNQDKAIKAYKS